MLSEWERSFIERKLHEPAWRARLQKMQDVLEGEFRNFKDQCETLLVRTIIPRDGLKELPSVLSKVKRRRSDARKSQKRHTLYDLTDLIGIKVICPYPRDVREVFFWMKRHPGLAVSPTRFQAGRKDDPTGYKGYHFSVHLRGPLLVHNEELTGIVCEVQLKTMLEEAWDAKTHDVSYKQAYEVPATLRDAMKRVSDDLALLDSQTQFLEDLILARKKQEQFRKAAAATAWLHESGGCLDELLTFVDEPSPSELLARKFNQTNVIKLILPTEMRRAQISESLCRVAALVALYSRRPQLKTWALDLCDELLQRYPDNLKGYITKGAVCWALDRLDDAIEAASTAIQRAEENREHDIVRDAKNTYAYWIAEKVWSEGEKDPTLINQAFDYVESAIVAEPKSALNYDTKGFLLIATGTTKEEIETGWKFINKALRLAKNEEREVAKAFHKRHSEVARIRLKELGVDKSSSSVRRRVRR